MPGVKAANAIQRRGSTEIIERIDVLWQGMITPSQLPSIERTTDLSIGPSPE